MHPSHLVAELKRLSKKMEDARVELVRSYGLTGPPDSRTAEYAHYQRTCDEAAEMIDQEFGPFDGNVYVDGEGAPKRETEHTYVPESYSEPVDSDIGERVRDLERLYYLKWRREQAPFEITSAMNEEFVNLHRKVLGRAK